jgi:hypothetical protein
MDDGDRTEPDRGSEPDLETPRFGTAPRPRRGLRTASWIVGGVVVVMGFLVVGMGIWIAAGISQWSANK